jgi:hypothetical protein
VLGYIWSILLALSGSAVGATNDISSPDELLKLYAPGCYFQSDTTGKQTLVGSDGSTLDLSKAIGETPMPTNAVIGYWFSSSMDFLSAQKLEAATAKQAIGIVQLLHAMSQRDPTFVRQKLYSAQKFGDAWVVDVDHDFTNYNGNIMQIQPYELIVNKSNRVERLRERCYHYLGSAEVYTNTVSTVYEREIKRDNGLNYPEKLFDELREAWAREKSAIQTPSKK